MSTRARLDYVDIAKAIGIFLMVLAHQHIYKYEWRVIYSFHMPLFFILSGMFFNENKGIRENISSAFKRLIIPYFVFNVLNLAISWSHPYFHPDLYYNMSIGESFRSAIIGTLLGDETIRPYSYMPNNKLWFLVALFNMRLICSLAASFLKANKYIFVLIISGLSILLFYKLPVIGLFSISPTLLALPFYLIGFLAKDLLKNDKLLNHNYSWVVIVVVLLYVIFVSPLNGSVNLGRNGYGSILFLCYLNGSLGTLLIICISLKINSISHPVKNIIVYFGVNTLIVLGMYPFIESIIQFSLYLVGFSSWYSASYLFNHFMAVLIVLGCYPLCWFINKYMPFAVGDFKVKP